MSQPAGTGRQNVDRLLDEARAFRTTDPQRCLALATEALQSAKRQRYSNGIARALRATGLAQWICGNLNEALTSLRKGAALADRLGDRQLLASCVNGIAITLEKLGDFAGAVDHHEQFLDMVPGSDYPVAVELTVSNVGLLHARLGDFEAAYALFSAALNWGRRTGRTQPLLEQDAAVSAFHLGRDRDAERHLQRALRGYADTAQYTEQLQLMANVGSILIGQGKLERARGALQDAHALADRLGVTRERVMADLNLARLQLHSGDAAGAERSFAATLERARASGDVFQTLLAEQGHADALAALGRTQEAFSLLATVLKEREALLARCGTRRIRQRIYALHERLAAFLEHDAAIDCALPDGRRKRYLGPLVRTRQALLPPGAPSAERDMTARELEVLPLLVAGKTNKQIALDLKVSHYTVRFHVSSILAKLGARTRAEAVARAMAEKVLDGSPKRR